MNRAPSIPSCGLRRDLPRWQHLVTPAWIAALAAGSPVAAAPAGAWRLVEVGSDERAAFAAGHIPGAGYLDTALLEGGPVWNKVPDPQLERVLLGHGIRHDVTVILYARNVLAAARAAHLLLYAGVTDVRLLDGGFAAWRRAGGALERGLPRPCAPAAGFGAAFAAQPAILLDLAQTRDLLARGAGALVSIRTWTEFIGATSGYSYIEAKGDIPGALWGRAGVDGDINSMADFHDAHGCMKPAADIAAMWRAAGIHPGRATVFYCGTGWRASLAFFYAWLMGWERIAGYDGGWCEWSRAAPACGPAAHRCGGRAVTATP